MVFLLIFFIVFASFLSQPCDYIIYHIWYIVNIWERRNTRFNNLLTNKKAPAEAGPFWRPIIIAGLVALPTGGRAQGNKAAMRPGVRGRVTEDSKKWRWIELYTTMTVIFSKSVIPPSFLGICRHQDCVKTRFWGVSVYKMHKLWMWYLFYVVHFMLRMHFLGYPTVTTVIAVIAVHSVIRDQS